MLPFTVGLFIGLMIGFFIATFVQGLDPED